jgi:serine protease Do
VAGPSDSSGRRRRPNWPLILVLALALGVALALGATAIRRFAGPSAVTASASKPMAFPELFERVSPAVVSLRVAGQDRSALRFLQPRGERAPTELSPAGSGFFVSGDGLLVTNAHLIEGARAIGVKLQDGRVLPAEVVGVDETIDLAVLKARDPGNRSARFSYVDFADASKPRVGDWILAVGDPYGLGSAATAGIVSAWGRDIDAAGLVEYLQLDAAINRGDFGGPSFDIYGRVVGVNTAMVSPDGGSIGIAFAIPADVARDAVKQLATGKQIQRGFIGATIQTLSADIAAAQGLAGRKGALVAAVADGGPAERAGLKTGDVVVAVDGEPVETSSALTRKVAAAGPNKSVRLDIIRDGRARAVTVRTGMRPPPKELEGAFREGPR